MNNQMTNLKSRNLFYFLGLLFILFGTYQFITKNLTLLSFTGIGLLAILCFLIGYFKFQKQHINKAPYTDEYTIKSKTLAGYKAFMFYFITALLFNPLFTYLSKSMEWDDKNKYFFINIGHQLIFIITILIFIILKFFYIKKGVPEKFK